jgi:hypothetical protein
MLEMNVTPRALTADLSQFEPAPRSGNETAETEEPEDSLLELLRKGSALQQDEFLAELRRQRSGEPVST